MIRIKNKKQPLKNSLFWTFFLCKNGKSAHSSKDQLNLNMYEPTMNGIFTVRL